MAVFYRSSPAARFFLYVFWGVFIATFAMLPGRPAAAQPDSEKPPSVQDAIAREVSGSERKNFLTLTVENDLFGAGTDGDYTSGVRLSYFDIGERPKDIGRWLDSVIPTFSVNETTSISYSLGQNLYTPDDITIRAAQPEERPWAAFLYGSVNLSSIKGDRVDDVEATIGVVGPWAQGERTQKFFHKLVDTRNPRGWDNQIENEPGLMLSWRRRWPRAYLKTFDSLTFAVEPNIAASVGNIYTLASAGMTLRLTPSYNRWQDTPLLVRPAIPGSGFFEPQQEHLGWYLFTGIQGRAVARNIFLDGNTFESSASVDKKPFVMDASAGIAFTYGAARISYTAIYRTKEFYGQDDEALFGAVSIGYRF